MQVTKDMSVYDILEQRPKLVKVFIELGMPCFVCGEPFWGTLEQLAHKHDVEVEDLVNKLNEQVQKIYENI